MNVRNIKWTYSRPLFMKLGKHYCPFCGDELKKQKVSQIVNSKSEEAKNFDFSSPAGDGYMIGNVKFINTHLWCSKCDKVYTFKEIHAIEKKHKKR